MKSMKRILFINDEMTIGGVETVLLTVLKYIDFSKYNVDLLLDYKTERDGICIDEKVNVMYVYGEKKHSAFGKFSRYCRALMKELYPVKARKIISKGNYDCVIDFKGASLSYLRGLKCPTVFWNHKDFSIETNPYERRFVEVYGKTPAGKFKLHFLKKNIRVCTHIVCISNTMKQHFAERFGYEHKVQVIYNAIDSLSIVSKSHQQIDDLPVKTKFTFCCVSRITEGKGIERLLHAVKRLNDLGYVFSMVIVGDGDKIDEILALKEQLGLINVYFTGRKENPYPYYVYADVVILPSENEAAPLVVSEAIILKKALIATNVGSVAEMLDHSKYGLLVPSSEDGIFEGMKQMLSSPELVQKYEAASEQSELKFGLEKVMDTIERFLDAITEQEGCIDEATKDS